MKVCMYILTCVHLYYVYIVVIHFVLICSGLPYLLSNTQCTCFSIPVKDIIIEVSSVERFHCQEQPI